MIGSTILAAIAVQGAPATAGIARYVVGIGAARCDRGQAVFQEAAGLSTTAPTAGDRKTATLILRRGYVTRGSRLWRMVERLTLPVGRSTPVTLSVSLCGAQKRPLAAWLFPDARPIRVSADHLASQGEQPVETLEFAAAGRRLVTR